MLLPDVNVNAPLETVSGDGSGSVQSCRRSAISVPRRYHQIRTLVCRRAGVITPAPNSRDVEPPPVRRLSSLRYSASIPGKPKPQCFESWPKSTVHKLAIVRTVPQRREHILKYLTGRHLVGVGQAFPDSSNHLAHERIVFQAHSPRNGLFKRKPDIVGTNASRDRHKGLRTFFATLRTASKPSSAQTSAKSRIKP